MADFYTDIREYYDEHKNDQNPPELVNKIEKLLKMKNMI